MTLEQKIHGASNRTKLSILILTGIIVFTVVLFIPPVYQDQEYHNFADKRTIWGIPHFGDVITHILYLIFGLIGLGWMFTKNGGQKEDAFIKKHEALSYYAFFASFILVALGSTWYHWNPNDDTLFWDRLPLTVTFMSLVGIIIAERISSRAGIICLPILSALGLGTILYWSLLGGDLRPYGLVQFYPMIAMPMMIVMFPPRYSNSGFFWIMFAWYGVAKVFELLDYQIYDMTGFITGHNIKHVCSGLSVLWVYAMLRRRRILED